MSLRKFPHARRFPRVYLQPAFRAAIQATKWTTAKAAWDGGGFLPVYDLSHTGLAVVLPKGVVPIKDEVVRLRLCMDGEAEVEIDANVARISETIVAFEFHDLETDARVALERFLSAKVRGLHLRPIDPSLFARDEDGEEDFTHWFQGPADTNILLWYESIYLKRAKIEIGDEWLEWEAGVSGEYDSVLRTSGCGSPFVTRVLDMLSHAHNLGRDEEKVLEPLFDALSRSVNRAA